MPGVLTQSLVVTQMRIGKLRASQLTSICKLFYLTQPIYVLAVPLSPDCSKRNRNVAGWLIGPAEDGDHCQASN